MSVNTVIILLVLLAWGHLVREHWRCGPLATLPLSFFGGIVLTLGAIGVTGMVASEHTTTFGVGAAAVIFLGGPIGLGYGLLALRRSSARRRYDNAVAAEAQFQQDVQGQMGGGHY